MGRGSYSDADWKGYSTSRRLDDPSTGTEDIYRSRGMDPMLDPHEFGNRESVDGPDHPESTPLILALDVTGSMSTVLDDLARKGMKVLCEEVYKRRPITDPHICCCGIGDVAMGDRAPFQATQFEADVRIFEQLEKLFLEGGGGGNCFESYILAWYFAKFRTKTDSFAKRGRKGFLFTIGDEEVTPSVSAGDVFKAMGDQLERGMTAKELYDLVSTEWQVYHIIIKQGSHARGFYPEVRKSWDDVIGAQRVVPLDDYTKLGETVVSILEVMAGRSIRDVTESWDGSTSVVVGNALKDVTPETSQAVDIDSHL